MILRITFIQCEFHKEQHHKLIAFVFVYAVYTYTDNSKLHCLFSHVVINHQKMRQLPHGAHNLLQVSPYVHTIQSCPILYIRELLRFHIHLLQS